MVAFIFLGIALMLDCLFVANYFFVRSLRKRQDVVVESDDSPKTRTAASNERGSLDGGVAVHRNILIVFGGVREPGSLCCCVRE